MALEVIVKNNINSGRYITDFGISIYPLIGVDLILEGDVDDPEGFMMGMDDVRAMFQALIGDCWENHVLYEDGEDFTVANDNMVGLDFSPSMENIAKYIYELLLLPMMREFHVVLVGVLAKSDIGDAYYAPEDDVPHCGTTNCK